MLHQVGVSFDSHCDARCIKLVFHLTYTSMHGNTKLKNAGVSLTEMTKYRSEKPSGKIPPVYVRELHTLTAKEESSLLRAAFVNVSL